jgi:hypothetical protein
MQKYNQYNINDLLKIAPVESYWALGDYTLNRAIRLGIPLKRGGRGRLIKFILNCLYFKMFQYAAIVGIGFIEGIRLWATQLLCKPLGMRYENNLNHRDKVSIFVTCSVRTEGWLLAKYQQLSKQPVVQVSENKLALNYSICNIGLMQFLTNLIKAFKRASKFYDNLPKELECYRIDFLTYSAMRLGRYSWMRTFWENVRSRYDVVEVNFINTDTAAFAAVDAKLNTSYQQHGFLSKGLLFADFKKIVTLTEFDAHYIRASLPNAYITCRSIHSLHPSGESKSFKTVLIVSELRAPSDISIIKEIISFFDENFYQIVIRPAPNLSGLNSAKYWDEILCNGNLKASSSGVEKSFDDLLNDLRPQFVIAWISTTLADALYSGVVPITLAHNDDLFVDETVYPILECCLSWYEDMVEIEKLMSGLIDLNAVVKRLRDNEISIIKRIQTEKTE